MAEPQAAELPGRLSIAARMVRLYEALGVRATGVLRAAGMSARAITGGSPG